MDTDNSKRKPWGCITTLMLLSPVAYLLMLGPAVWLHDRSPRLVQECIELLYWWVDTYSLPT